MKSHYSLVIIGSGPAGLAAATLAADHGLDVALLDEQNQPGGQIFRNMESMPASRVEILGGDYQRGQELVEAFRASDAHYFPETRVWSLNTQGEMGLIEQGMARMISADKVLIANGAMERPVPFPGWTLPGVMYAGAGQILFKQAGLVPMDGVVLAGSGPLLLLLAWQYIRAGVTIQAILDTAPLTNLLRALPHLPRALMAHHYITKGLEYQNEIKRAGVPIIKGISSLEAQGEMSLERVSYRKGLQRQQIETQCLLTHFGVIPHVYLSRAAGLKHHWDHHQQCLRPVSDEWGETSSRTLFIAGDGGGIGGARSAEHAGRLAAFQILYQQEMLTKQQRNQLAKSDRQWMREDLHIRPFLERLFHLPPALLNRLPDNTIVCRCEEITAGEIRREIASGHDHSNQVKFITRSGMGACQGRQCSQAVAQIVADQSNQVISSQSLYRVRPPVASLSLGQLASLFPEEQE
ncbi:MAG: NAD(P)/FAD-dependent oxidoreductase [Gammaproteobacteria bacterium]|nr:NAD(P)/FAD-dependent oxidoreductase [Gammaproteobacteria bacterium]